MGPRHKKPWTSPLRFRVASCGKERWDPEIESTTEFKTVASACTKCMTTETRCPTFNTQPKNMQFVITLADFKKCRKNLKLERQQSVCSLDP